MATIQTAEPIAPAQVSSVDRDQTLQNGEHVDGTAYQNGDAVPTSNGASEPPADAPESAGERTPTKPKAAISEDAKPKSSKPNDANAKADTKPTGKTALILSSGKFGVQSKGQPARPMAEAATASAKPPLSPTKSKVPPAPPVTQSPPESPSATVETADGDASPVTELPAAPVPALTPSPTKSAIPASSKMAKPGDSGAQPIRRMSMAPPSAAVKPLVKPGPPPSTSSTVKPAPPRTSATGPRPSVPASNLGRTTTAIIRKSVVSPTPSTSSVKSGPKPSVAANAEKKSMAPRPSIAASTSRTGSAIRSATSKPGPSLTGAKEEKKTDTELEQKYNDAVTELTTKSERILSLETELEVLRSGLDRKIAEINERTTELEELRESVNTASEARKNLDDEVKRLQGASDSLESDHQKKFGQAESDLSAARAELEAALQEVQNHKESHATLEGDLTRVQEELKTLSSLHSNNTASAEIDRAALLQAQADLNAIKVETDSITAGHAMTISDYEQTIAGLKSHVKLAEKSVESLRDEVEALKREREEISQKLSELEVEILEMQDEKLKAQDEREKELAAVKVGHGEEKTELRKAMELELAKAIEAHQDAAKKWEEASAAAHEQHSETLAAAVKEAEATATTASEKLQTSLAESHAEALWEKEVELLQKTEGLEKRIKQLEEDLKVEESKTEAQVAVIEAGETHAQELAVLREQSKATLEQVKTAHRNEIDSITASHEETLGSQVKSLEKQISVLKLELSATKDDLAKAKGSLSSARSEVDSLRAQVDQAVMEAQIARTASGAEKEAAVADLAKRFSNTQQEMNDLNEAFKMSQDGFVEELGQVKQNHQRELEEASKNRVQALEELQKSHDEMLGKLKADLANVKTQLDDQREEAQRAVSEAAALKARSPPATPNAKAQTNGVVSKDDLAKLHQAHQAKVAELESDRDKRVKDVTEQNEALARSNAELQASLEHKEMERSMYEIEANDTQDEIAALKAELERMRAA
ncbi:hypothetical protein FRB96_006133 [Tulasnella sp. 330]|nr:hypothetical protein FRB96_006133 [Tulasnella sp. 330]KAG8887683.1 hypothetical protein FRB98_009193 [Tulasnella sp. 332]